VRSGNVTVDPGEREVMRGSTRVHLSLIEFRLLAMLVHHAGRLMTHNLLLHEVWGTAHAEDAHYLRDYVGHSHRRLERDPRRPKHVGSDIGSPEPANGPRPV